MGWSIFKMVSGAILMPVVAQVEPTSLAGQLAVGGAQAVLASVVVVQAIAIWKLYVQMNKNTEAHQAYMANETKVLTEVIAKNEVAFAANTDSIEKLTTELQERRRGHTAKQVQQPQGE